MKLLEFLDVFGFPKIVRWRRGRDSTSPNLWPFSLICDPSSPIFSPWGVLPRRDVYFPNQGIAGSNPAGVATAKMSGPDTYVTKRT
jgi:hypothetical protein